MARKRKRLYSKSTLRCEENQYEKDWERRLELALEDQNYIECKDLIIEGIREDYNFPQIFDSNVLQLMHELGVF